MEKKTIYFLCTGNSCRSQMAEGWAQKYLGDRWNVYSAGIEAHGLNPKAVQAMNEIGIDISGQTSDIIDPALLNSADLVVTLCGDAADKCPITPPHVRREHWGFDDPAKAKGTEEEKWSVFQRVRDEVEARIRKFAETGK
ncbi:MULTISPECIES: arsenate reductase (thioredoxin) [unclassified Paenibacillus]|uniref:arsenate reductase (thioredoxin) n=1 Tax=unclassified Paenibacillus TaxID=185978 RepID=UPI0020B6EBB3|nr:arsenate reductase (thioredoxin) [Paenibacillus sp. MZ03-122A]MCP3780190.1 arsenate reductase (thioredoxin) [Paenibacillus sp. MZ03-122A]